MAQSNPYPLRVEKKLMEKFKVVAKGNGRSVNKELEQMIINAVSAYEKDHGSIPTPILSEDEE